MRTLLVSVAAAVVAAGAGVTDAAAAPSKTEFIRRGDVLCARATRELVPLRRRAEGARTLPHSQKWRATASIWRDQVRIQERLVTRLHRIGVPRGDAAALRIVRGIDHGLALAREVRDGFVGKDLEALAAALPRYIRFTLALNARVRAYGFRVCGR